MSNMVEVKTAELVGPALDWAVANVEAMPVKHDPMGFGRTENGGFWVWGDSISGPMLKIGSASKLGYSPSTNWELGGPLRDKYDVGIEPGVPDGLPYAYVPGREIDGSRGETALIALCRAIVAAKLGDVVQVPAELAGEV
ncbi:phage protein NinX family protein [Aeromonas piscicola]|uniref:phage protein NinX family protein n=1 Tax=Aeromonas piscicola TaxID=600645 RepID=UPI0005B44FBB|nr:phage protein NinX family protein [Aeromonas piscicola]